MNRSTTCGILALLTAAVAACDVQHIEAPGPVIYPLRSVTTAPDVLVGVPTAIPSIVPGDSTRVIAGSFVLGLDRMWALRLTTQRVSSGVGGTAEQQIFSGRYTVRATADSRALLDLFPGQAPPGVPGATAVVHGDTLRYGPYIFVQTPAPIPPSP